MSTYDSVLLSTFWAVGWFKITECLIDRLKEQLQLPILSIFLHLMNQYSSDSEFLLELELISIGWGNNWDFLTLFGHTCITRICILESITTNSQSFGTLGSTGYILCPIFKGENRDLQEPTIFEMHPPVSFKVSSFIFPT